MAFSVENIINMALDAVGYPQHVQDIYEGSPAARVALELYSQTRDETLQAGDWAFSKRETSLATNGQTAPSPWSFEYTYPTDCLRVLQVRPGPLTGGTRSLDPQPILYTIWNDTRPGTPVRAILADQASAVLMYVGKVTDPSTWEPQFTKTFVAALAGKFSFSPMLAMSAELIKARISLSDRDMTEGQAVGDSGNVIPPQYSQQPAAAR